jgi:glycosyltransferase involved in cell wall biosynthesis
MVQAMALLPGSLHARLVLAGKCDPPELHYEVTQMTGWSRAAFVGWQSQDEVEGLLGRARVGLVLYHPVPNHKEAQPHKLYEYMCAGIPLIASDFPLWRNIIEEARCGMLVDPLDPKAIARAITWLLEHPKEAETMGIHGQKAANARFNWTKEEAKLLHLYQSLFPLQPSTFGQSL